MDAMARRRRKNRRLRWLVAGLVVASGVAGMGVSFPSAEAAVARPDLFWVRPAGATGVPGPDTKVEVHVLDGASTYTKWQMHAASSRAGVSAQQWRFVVGDANGDDVADLYMLNVAAGDNKRTDLHVYDGRTRYTTTLLNQVLPNLGGTSDAARYQFFAADMDADGRDDLYAVDARDNGGKNTAVHVYDAGDRFESFLAHRRLPVVGAADLSRWQFGGGDVDGDNRADVYMINGADSGGKKTAVHITPAATGYTKATINRHLHGLAGTTTSRWRFSVADYNADGRGDVFGIDSQDNGGKSTAVHIAYADTNFTTGTHRRTSMAAFDLAKHPTITAWAPTKRVTGDVTLAELQAIFGAIPNADTVARGLPSLNAQMRAAGITTPRRKAAFLATLRHESVFKYNAVQGGATSRYRGRGYIQLTGEGNYRSAGDSLNHDFLAHPDDAASLAWSAAIARWYWTVARDINPMADRLDMGAVNKAIGYAPEAAEDAERCADFKAALNYYLGSVPGGVKCAR